MAAKNTRDTLIGALIVVGVCAAIVLWTRGEQEQTGALSRVAFIVGGGALIVAAFCALGWIFGALGRLIEDRRWRIEAEARAERHTALEASRDRHCANRAAWLRQVRNEMTSAPPAWHGDNRAAFVWLYARQGKTVTIRGREEDRKQRYKYGEHNATGWEAQAPTDWISRTWIVELPDEALNPIEYDDHVDESGVAVHWVIAGVTTLPVTAGKVAVDARGIEIRSPPHSWSDVNDYDHGYFGTYTKVVRIED